MEYKMLKFDDEGLIPAIVQDFKTGKVLMMAYMNEESLRLTIESGYTWFYSRSRKKLWNKGEISGNTQEIMSLRYDCDGDTLLVRVKQKGVACHTGGKSCFYNELYNRESELTGKNTGECNQVDLKASLDSLYDVVADRKSNPKENSYTNYLFDKGIDKILKKVGEESAETVIAAKNNDKNELILEASDLIYHLTVLLVEKGVTYDDIALELEKRSLSDK